MKTNSKVSKRIISLVLTVLLVLSMVPMSVFSAFAEDVAEHAEHIAEQAENLPELRATIDTGAEVTLSDADGDGYYDINTADELYAFAELVNGGNLGLNAELTADIVVNEGTMSADTEGAREWTPIGYYDSENYVYYGYSGIFDGKDHTVSGLYFNNSEAECVGLFGYVSENGTVKNTGVINSYFNGYRYVSGVVGYNYNGTITNCYNTGIVSSSEGVVSGVVGGVVGFNYGGTITNCYNTGEVSGSDSIGGVIGENYNGTITKCYNTGKVSGSEGVVSGVVGGVIGYNYEGLITNCHNTGVVSGSESVDSDMVGGAVGGVVGYNSTGNIENCYNTGAVSGNEKVGGVIGYNYQGLITNCHNTGLISGDENIGGVVGYNYQGSTKSCYYLNTTCSGGINGEDVEGSAEAKTAEQFASGEVAYLLQGEQTEEIWGQTIGTEDYPILGGDKVYYGYVSCADDATLVYTNNAKATAEKPDHTWEDGKCTACEKDCEHDWYSGTCDICGIECSHPEHTLEMGVSPDEDDLYYVNAEAHCSTCGDYLFYYSDYAEVVSKEEAKDCLNKGSVTLSFTGEDYDGNLYPVTETIEVESDNHVGPVENGFCSACGGYESAKYNEETGAYEIANAGQLYWFAEQVNVHKNNSISAMLVADIVVNEDMSAENLIEWTPIGSSSTAYCGNFDGQGYTVSGLYCKADENYVGLFGKTDYNYRISNLGVKDSYFEGNSYVGAFVGYASSLISNCFVDNVEVVCNGNIGADFVGYNIGEISNSYSTSDSFVGNSYYGTITNCYYLADTDDGNGGKTAEQFASGEVAYLLQAGVAEEDIYDDEWNVIDTILPEIWGQTIGTDKYPIFGGLKVYQVENCKGETAYSNINENIDHIWENGKCTVCEKVCEHEDFDENGFCTVCGGYEPATDVDNDGVYEIGNAGQLYWFADKVNNDNRNFGSANAILTANIVVNEGTMTADTEGAREWTPIGTGYSYSYKGTFDGNDHTVSGLYFNNSEAEYVGLFGYVGTNGTVKNTGVINSYFNGNQRVGSVVGINSGTIENCYNEGTVSGSVGVGGVVGYNVGTITNCYNTGAVSGNERIGGVVGENYGTITNCNNTGEVSGSGKCVGGVVGYNGSYDTITNCYNTGEVSGSLYVGGVVGENGGNGTIENCYNTGEVSGRRYVGGVSSYNSSTGTIENCYNTGKVSGSDSYGGGVVGCNYGTITNCYYLNTACKGGIGITGTTNAKDIEGSAEAKTAEQFASGEVAYLLGEAYGQKIGTDTYPVLGGDKVYGGYTYCGDEEMGYTNNADELSSEKPAHNFDSNGFCTICGGYEPATLNEDGVYEIGNAGQLYWFAEYVNAGNGSANAILTADIVVNEGTMTAETTGAREWTPIGKNSSYKYTGTFDGNDYTISGLYFNNSEAEYVGLFGWVEENGTVKNTGVINSYFNGSEYVGGVVGRNNRGTITNCYNTGEVSGSSNVGGVAGKNYSGIIENSYNTGEISGSGTYVGGVVGSNNYGTIEDCYNTGEVSGSRFVGGVAGETYDSTITNCYNTGAVSGSSNVGGVAGYNNGTITNCYNTGAVSGNYYVGGVAGNSSDGTIINCYNTGTVSGNERVGGVVGKNDGIIENCYYLDTAYKGGIGMEGTTDADDIEGETEAKTAEQFASGEVAYLLGEAFGQKLGTDQLPVLGGDKVYAVTNCKGEAVSYNNTKAETLDHNFENGFCTVCGGYEPATDVDNDGVYEIGNAGQLYWFAEYVNAGNTSPNAILTADIVVNEGTMSAETTGAREWTPIGNYSSKRYTGTFNGNDHTVSGLYFNNSEADYVGLFGHVGTNGTVKNTGVINSYFNGNKYVGGVAGWNDGTIENCYNTGKVSAVGQQLGGVVGRNDGTITNSYNTGEVSGSSNVGGVAGSNFGTIENCYNTGKVSAVGQQLGGVVGSNSGTITNSYNTGEVSGSEHVGGVVGCIYEGTITNCYNEGYVSGSDLVGGVVAYIISGTITNCYYLNTTCSGGINGKDVIGSAEAKTAEQFASGEVAYLLGEAFGQKLGTDELPVLGGDKVYVVTNCKGELVGFSNTEGKVEHFTFDENGFCTVCGAFEPATLNEDGVYEIGNAGQLYWFAEYVNAGNTSANAILTANIVVNEGTMTAETTGAREWTPISKGSGYRGVFDGNDYTISGLYFNNSSDRGCFGLFGFVGDNGIIKNTGVINSYFNNYDYVGGVVGENYGTITNCYNEGEVIGYYSVGGVVGYNGGTITNCYNKGYVGGSFFVGGVASYNSGTITNCYNTGEVNRWGNYVGGVVGDNNGTTTNCYYLDTACSGGINDKDVAGSAEAKTAQQFASGEVAYLLGEAFGQKIGTDTYPVLGGDKVYLVENCKGELGGYSNTDEPLDHNFENGFCTVCGAMDGVAQVKGYSISLGGNIAVNYYMVLADEVLADENAEMVFTVPNGDSTYEVRIPVSSVTPDAKGYYVFTCEVAAKEMASVIKTQIVTSDKESDVFEYTVKQYAEYILEMAEKADPNGAIDYSSYVKAAPLVKAMLNYGANAQVYFNYNTDNLANATLDEAEKALVDNLDLSAYNVSVNGSEEGVTFYGGALSLKSETAIKLYFVIEEGTDIPEVTVNGEKAELTQNGNLYELKISDIPAHMLDEMFEVKIGSLTVNYGAFSYGYAAMNSGKEALVNTIKALYAYNQKAVEYLG